MLLKYKDCVLLYAALAPDYQYVPDKTKLLRYRELLTSQLNTTILFTYVAKLISQNNVNDILSTRLIFHEKNKKLNFYTTYVRAC